MPLENLTVPQGSTILVTGVNGFLGSYIADQFFQHGFTVRGMVRDVAKNAWLADLFRQNYGQDRFELWGVPNMAVEGALDEAAKGVATVAYTTSIMSLDHDPNRVILPVVAFAFNTVKAADVEPSAKSFVFCSSLTVAVFSVVGKPGAVVTEETWNDEAVREAWADPTYTPERSHTVYSASKVLAEKAILEY